MIRLLPYVLLLALGFITGAILVRRSGPGSGETWESKYREIFNRYRDLTKQLQGVEQRGDLKANRLRQRLIEVAGMLNGNGEADARKVKAALEMIESALREV